MAKKACTPNLKASEECPSEATFNVEGRYIVNYWGMKGLALIFFTARIEKLQLDDFYSKSLNSKEQIAYAELVKNARSMANPIVNLTHIENLFH